MSVVVYCPSCQTKIRAPDNVMGKQIRCPSCQSTFAVSGTPAPAAAVNRPAPSPADPSPFHQLDDAPPPDAIPDRPSRAGAAAPRRSNAFVDYLLFRRMITPIVIQILFWLGVIAIVASSGVSLVLGVIVLAGNQPEQGLLTILLAFVTLFIGPLVLRIYCEILILFFRMNETLTEVRNTVERLAQK